MSTDLAAFVRGLPEAEIRIRMTYRPVGGDTPDYVDTR